jgi:hypothetical protein
MTFSLHRVKSSGEMDPPHGVDFFDQLLYLVQYILQRPQVLGVDDIGF